RTRSALLAGMGQPGLSRSVPRSKPHRLAGVDLLKRFNTPLDQQFGRAFGEGSDFDLVATPGVLAGDGDVPAAAGIRVPGEEGVLERRALLDLQRDPDKRLAGQGDERGVVIERHDLHVERPVGLALVLPGEVGAHGRALAAHRLATDVLFRAAALPQLVEPCEVLLELRVELVGRWQLLEGHLHLVPANAQLAHAAGNRVLVVHGQRRAGFQRADILLAALRDLGLPPDPAGIEPQDRPDPLALVQTVARSTTNWP